MNEANRATMVEDEGKFVAISTGIISRSPLWYNIHKNPINKLHEFLDIVDKYIKLNDAIMKEEKGINNPVNSKVELTHTNP